MESGVSTETGADGKRTKERGGMAGLLRRFLEPAEQGVYCLDLQGNCTFCNRACLEILGYQRPEQLLGKNMHQLVHHSYPDGTPLQQEDCHIYATLRDGVLAHSHEEVFWRADHTYFPAEYWTYPSYFDGMVVGFVVTFIDASSRKRAEEALRESDKRYRDLVENATYGITQTTPDGRFLDANPALVAMLGYESKDDLMALNVADLYCDPRDRAAVLQNCEKTGHVRDMELDLKTKDGTPIVIRLTGRAVRGDTGQAEYFECFVEEVTERRMLERELMQAQRIEAIGRLAGGVAHDFNNILGVIIGYSELLMGCADVAGDQAEGLVEIRKAAERGAAVTHQLLAFSRKQVLEPKVLDLNAVVSDMSKMLLRLLGEHIELAIKLNPRLGSVKADPTQIGQAIVNLAVNARDAMPQGGRLTLETDDLEMNQGYLQDGQTPVPRGRYIMLQIRDTGTGMSEETLGRIFDPFFTTKERGKGTGLGLATVYGIVKQSGGFI